MSGLCVNSVPTTSPRPVTTLITPGGRPASWKASINTSVCIALISLGLMTTVHPAAIAGATLIAIEPALEFQGVNMPTTPAVFQNRRVNELIHSLGNGIMQPLQAVHAVFLAALRKGIPANRQ